MKLTRYTDADAFITHVTPFLAAHEAQNNLVLGILSSIHLGNYADVDHYLACVEHEGEVVLVAIRTPPYNLILSYTDHPDSLALVVEDAQKTYGTMSGIVALKHIGQYFAEQWAAATGQSHRVEIAERTYQLEQVSPVEGVAGTMRYMTEADRPLILEWMRAFMREALNDDDEKRAEDNIVRRFGLPREKGGLCVWEVEGQVVSVVGYGGPTPNGLRVGPVYTPPELRGHGYASALTAAVSQQILDMGRKYCFLFTDLANPTSNHIYQTIGYRPVCDVDMVQFE